MYTGVIRRTGDVTAVEGDETGGRIRVAAAIDDLRAGDSVAVSGVCLTADRTGDGWFEADLSAATVARTYLLEAAGTTVNVERPVTADGRFDGHVLRGTVDATATVVGMTERADDWWLEVAVPEGYGQYLVENGAVALDGISLTVERVGDGTIGVAVVPATYERTTLSETAAGDRLHVETDVLAKYAAQTTGDSSDEGDGVGA